MYMCTENGNIYPLLFYFFKNYYEEWMLDFFQMLFSIYGYHHMAFPHRLINMMNYISQFSNVEPFLHSWYKSYFIMIYYFLTVVLESVSLDIT